MVVQIPRDKLVDYLSFFSEIKYLRNVLTLLAVRGSVDGYVDNLEKPSICLIGSFLAGNSNSPVVNEILDKIPEKEVIHVPGQEWVPMLSHHWKLFGYLTRTALSAKNLSLNHLRNLVKPLPEGSKVEKVDLETAKQIESQLINGPEKIKHYGGPEGFIKGAIGFCIKDGNRLASLAAGDLAPIPFTKSLEIDIQTLPEYRGRGFATIVAVKLMEYCLERGIEPHWDAANQRSVELALKLGYTDPEQYRCYYWRKEPPKVSSVKKYFDSKYKNGLEENKKYKPSLEFAEILSQIDEFVESGFVNPDEPYIKDLVKKAREQIRKASNQ